MTKHRLTYRKSGWRDRNVPGAVQKCARSMRPSSQYLVQNLSSGRHLKWVLDPYQHDNNLKRKVRVIKERKEKKERNHTTIITALQSPDANIMDSD